jgi:hypothetical protein
VRSAELTEGEFETGEEEDEYEDGDEDEVRHAGLVPLFSVGHLVASVEILSSHAWL